MKVRSVRGSAPGFRAILPAIVGLCLMAAGLAAASQSPAQAAAPAQGSVTVLMVSDIHFDPFLGTNAQIIPQLAQAPVTDWDKIFTKGLKRGFKPTGRFDTPFQLWQASLQAIRTNAAGVKFVTISGDLLAHDFDGKFNGACAGGNCGDLGSFAAQTIEYVLYELRESLPGVPVYAALGNNDSPCTDYELTPGSDFLKRVGKTITADVDAAERKQAVIDFSGAGYYRVTLPAPMMNTRLLIVDDIFLAAGYSPCPASTSKQPSGKPLPLIGGPPLPWLEKQLAEARADKQNDAKTWVMGHIPSGVDPYGTMADNSHHRSRHVCAGDSPAMFLPTDASDPTKPEKLQAILARFGDVIRLSIFAHSHMDELRLLPGTTKSDLPVAMKLVPSISPFNGNYPSITIATVDSKTAALENYRVIAGSDKTGAHTTWTQEYDFAQTYGTSTWKPTFTAASLEQLISGFDTVPDPGQQALYRQYYQTGGGGFLDAKDWHEYVCLMKNFTPADFVNCTCGTSQ